MAKRLGDLISSEAERPSEAEAEQEAVKPPKWRSVGVTLNLDELAEIDGIADSLDVARNGIIRLAITRFLADYRAGGVDIKTKAKGRTRRVII